MEKLGALAAFGTALCWSISALYFEQATRRAGAHAVNFWKVFFALFYLAGASLILRGTPLPLDASAREWLYLALSGLVGFVIADYFLFNAYLMIGSRITVVFQALTPFFTALLAFFFLGERMRAVRLVGMGVVICGILLVVISRQRPGEKSAVEGSAKGYAFAIFSSIFQAAGMIFSKIGLANGYNSISGTQIRVITAIIGFGLPALLLRKTDEVFIAPTRESKVFRNIAIGAVFGPFLGVTLSLFALQNTDAGTASTLIALNPVLIIIPSILVLKQKVKAMEIAGAFVAVCGAALFFLL